MARLQSGDSIETLNGFIPYIDLPYDDDRMGRKRVRLLYCRLVYLGWFYSKQDTRRGIGSDAEFRLPPYSVQWLAKTCGSQEWTVRRWLGYMVSSGVLIDRRTLVVSKAGVSTLGSLTPKQIRCAKQWVGYDA